MSFLLIPQKPRWSLHHRRPFFTITELKEMQRPTSEVPNQQPFALGEYLDRVDVPQPESANVLFRGFVSSEVMDSMTCVQRAQIYYDFEAIRELLAVCKQYQSGQPQSTPTN